MTKRSTLDVTILGSVVAFWPVSVASGFSLLCGIRLFPTQICELSSQSLLPGYHEIILPTNERVWIHYSSSESIVSIRNKGFPISSSSSQYERGLLIVKII